MGVSLEETQRGNARFYGEWDPNKLNKLKPVEVGGSKLYTRQQKQVGWNELGGSQSQESKVLCSVHVYHPDCSNTQVASAESL